MAGVIAEAATYDRIVLLHNPWNEAIARRCQDELTEWTPAKIAMLGTAAGGYEPNGELLQNQLEEGDALAVVGGDGTFRLAIGSLMLPGMEDLGKRISVTSLNQGGNACDIGRTLHGRWRKRPSQIFNRDLQAVTAYLMDCTIENETGIATYQAVSYLGIGKSANQTDRLNNDVYKKGRKIIRDASVVMDACLSDFTFDITTPDEQISTFGDISYAKAPCMAKLVRHQVEIWDPEIRVTPTGKGRLASIRAVGTMLAGKAPGFSTTQPSRFTTKSPVRVHFDGDPSISIPPESLVTIACAPKTYTALTTRKIS